MAWVTIALEFVGGFAVLLGAWIAVISVPLAAILLVAAITVHRPYGFNSIKLVAVTEAGPQFGPPGYETPLLYLAALATLVLGGAGPWSIEELIARQGVRTSNKPKSATASPYARGRTIFRLADVFQSPGRASCPASSHSLRLLPAWLSPQV